MQANCSSNACQEDCMPLSIDAGDFAWDPTMASCCLKDLQNQRKGDAVRRKLLAVDPTRQHAAVARSIPPPELKPSSAANHDDERLGGEEEEEDEQLAAIRERRKRELQHQLQQAAEGQAAGYGQLNDVAGSQLLERLESSSGCSVCHCAVEGHEPSNQLDQHLEALAHTFKGTLFMRMLVGRKSSLRTQLDLPSLPALVCFRNGAVVGRTGLLTFGPPEEVLEELVVDYLKRLRVLKQPASTSSGKLHKSRAGSLTSSSSEDDDREVDWKNPPCEVCGRCFPHEHVKAVYREHQSSDDEESNFD